MKTKLIFFDADGTLWNSKKEKPWKVEDVSLDKQALPLLKEIKRRKISVIIVSYQTHVSRKVAKKKLQSWLKHFKINKYIEEVHIADKKLNQKYKIINKVLKERKVSHKEAIMVGDRYKWDYLSAMKAHILGLLLNKPENKAYKVKKVSLKEVLKYCK